MIIGIDIRLIGKKRTGDEVVFFNLVKNLAKIDSKNEYKLFTDITDKKTIEEVGERLGIRGNNKFKIVSLETPNRFAWNFWTLPQYLRKNPVDVYQTQYITPFFVSNKIKIVTIIHDISFNFFPKFIKFSDLFFLKTLIPLSLHRADRVVAVSEFTGSEIIAFYGVRPEKVSVAYNAVADEFFQQASAGEIARVRNKYNLPEKYVLYVGTLQPRKNLPLLIESFAQIKDKLPEIKLVLAGNRKAHNFDSKIDDIIEKHQLGDKVIFPGYVEDEDKAAMIAGARVFAFPSRYEGFGIPILEAMSQGVPVLASNIIPHMEVAEDACAYFQDGALDSCSDMLYTLCVDENMRKKYSEKGLERFKFFSWQKTAYRTIAIYGELLHN